MGSSSEVGAIPYDKSNNVESSLFLIPGRITRKDFLLRFFLCVLLWGVVYLLFYYWDIQKYNEWIGNGGSAIQSETVQMEVRHTIAIGAAFYVLPIILLLFILIQAAKRVHDTNHSSLYLLVPLYNIYLLFSKGSIDDNDYGLLPHAETKSPSYKIEESPKSNSTNQVSDQISSIISSLSVTPSTANTRRTVKSTHALNGVIDQRERSRAKKATKNTKQQNGADNLFMWVIVGGFIVTVLLCLIAPWFISSMPIWIKLALVLLTVLGTWGTIYAIDDDHKGKYVVALGWGGFLAILLSTFITVYGIFGGFNDNSTDSSVSVVNHIKSREIDEKEVITEVSPKHHAPSTYVNISSGSSSFWIDKYEVTQEDYVRLMGNNPSTYTGDSLPVHGISVRDAVLYCNKKSEEDGCSGFYVIDGNTVTVKSDGNGYRLPTVSEWKQAANNSNASQMSERVMVKEKSYSDSRNYDSDRPHKVNEKKANRNGLYDMQSNVSELCVQNNGEIWGMGKNYRIHLNAYRFKVADNLSSTIKTDASIGLRLVFVP